MIGQHYIFQKDVDWSTLHQGISIPITYQLSFQDQILARGESRQISVIIDGVDYKAKLINQKFDKTKYPAHKDILQIRYSQNSEIACKLRDKFHLIYSFLLKRRNDRTSDDKRMVAIPENLKETIAIYSSNFSDTFLFECISNSEKQQLIRETKQLTESEYEFAINATDMTSTIYLSNKIVKLRKLNKAIGDSLKNLYKYRCQICEGSSLQRYQVATAEAHHIDPFTTSFNNDSSNLLILCPNHHSIVHKAKPKFDRASLSFQYQNGLIEYLKLNKHLGQN